MKKQTKNWITGPGAWPGLALLLLWLLLSWQLSKASRRKKMNTINDIGLTINGFLIDQGYSFLSKIITAQAAHETGNFSSYIFKANNNLFGMRHPKIRITHSLGEHKGYAIYSDIQDSILDILDWLHFHRIAKPFKTIDEYVTAIHERGYFEDKPENYIAGMKHFYNLYFGNQ